MAAALEIRDLTKVIGKKTIVDSLTFDVPRGEVFGLLGPNGAGKTTTIRMIVGLISITRGEVRVDGLDVTKDFAKAMQHIGVIVENPELYKFMTGYQNLVQFAKMSHGVTRERIDEVVAQVGLQDRIHERVKAYSLGMRQRLGLAQALLRRPDVIILDEPTNGLDPAGIRELRDYLRNLAAQDGTAVIVSSHLLSEMELMCDRVAIIQSGKLVDVRPIGEMIGQTGTAQAVEVDTDDAAAAIAVLKMAQGFEDVQASVEDGTLSVMTERDRIPDLVQALVAGGVRIYGVQVVSK
ncbi:MAG: ABC transporter ATP-binding protein, partial [Firmicutes bacterium]|nr:ABC transporter ATP-binding protein [Bacillota bacterium]